MYTLILSITCSVSVSILLKLAKSKNLDIRQSVALNYVVASALCLILLNPHPSSLLSPSTPFWILALLGFLLPTVFLIMAAAVRHAGIVFSDAAQRLSLLIPLSAAFLIFNEDISNSKAVGIALAFVALFLLLIRKKPQSEQDKKQNFLSIALLLGVWLGYGLADILFKQMAKSGAHFSSSLLISFVLAGILMFAWLILKKCQWNKRSIYAGVILGLLNFGNIYFYIRAHQSFPENPTLVFSAMNIGVISLGTIVGTAIFKEKLNVFNMAGIATAIFAVLLLMPK